MDESSPPLTPYGYPDGEAAADDLKNLGAAELVNHVRALRVEKSNLQALVCELLCANEELRRGS
jgi:hypothetical protein